MILYYGLRIHSTVKKIKEVKEVREVKKIRKVREVKKIKKVRERDIDRDNYRAPLFYDMPVKCFFFPILIPFGTVTGAGRGQRASGGAPTLFF